MHLETSLESFETTVQVCGRFPLVLQPGSGGFYGYLHTASSKNAACFYQLVKDLPTGMSVVEHFGGVGMFTTIIQNILKPSSHLAMDLDKDCAMQLRSLLGEEYSSQMDAKEGMGKWKADLIVCDFPNYSIKQIDQWPWDRVFAQNPRYVVWSDVALRRLGLHRAFYSRIFGSDIYSHEDYVHAASREMFRRYGYTIRREFHHVYSYCIAEPGDGTPTITHIRDAA
jgi:hypothetical protein